MIKFKWQLDNKIQIFNTFKELVNELRNGNVDEYNELSDEYIINESYFLGEWDYQ